MDEAMKRYLSRQITGLDRMREPRDEEFAAAIVELEAFREEGGGIPDWRSSDRVEARLGSWLEGQRDVERRGVLCEKRRALLEGVLGPRWVSPS
ncbi:helicase associated domain-containing protein [Sinomonas flava]